MAKYKLTKIKESEGDKHFYNLECMDKWNINPPISDLGLWEIRRNCI